MHFISVTCTCKSVTIGNPSQSIILLHEDLDVHVVAARLLLTHTSGPSLVTFSECNLQCGKLLKFKYYDDQINFLGSLP